MIKVVGWPDRGHLTILDRTAPLIPCEFDQQDARHGTRTVTRRTTSSRPQHRRVGDDRPVGQRQHREPAARAVGAEGGGEAREVEVVDRAAKPAEVVEHHS